MGRADDPAAVVDTAAARARHRAPARDRRVDHADHHLGQHQLADRDDRGAGKCHTQAERRRISESEFQNDRGGDCGAVRIRQRACPELSREDGAHPGALYARRGHRHAGAPARAQVPGKHGPELRGREPARRLRPDRHRARRARSRRWLHHTHQLGLARDQHRPAAEDGVRPVAGPGAREPDLVGGADPRCTRACRRDR